MKKHAQLFVPFVCFCLPVMFAGCTGSSLPTEYVAGTVTLDGQPLAEANIYFNPKEGGIPAYGTTDKDGKYVITAMQGGGQGAGTVPGDYIVTFTKSEPVPTNNPEVFDTKQLLHKVYATTAQSPFQETVVKGKNNFDFALKSDPGIEYEEPPEVRADRLRQERGGR